MTSAPALDKAVSDRAIDRYLKEYDVQSYYAIDVLASTTATYRAMRDLDLGRSAPVMALSAIRGIPHLVTGKAKLTRSLTLETVLHLGFTIFEDRPPEEFVIGVIGKFWRPDSGLVRVTPEEFLDFAEPGYSKAVLAFSIDEVGDRTRLATETRVVGTDAAARRRFAWYWRLIQPFSGFIRGVMLKEIKRSAEAQPSTARQDPHP